MTDRLSHFRATHATYQRHGWQLARALMTPETLAELRGATDAETAGDAAAQATFEDAPVFESDFDAMWFRRPSSGGREAWELRLPSQPYALFELFEPEEAEEDRADVRRELEQRARERVNGTVT